MKKLFIFVLAFIAVVSCSNSSDFIPESREKTVSIVLGGDYTFESFTRASVNNSNATDIWIFDYMNDNLIQTIHQKSDDIDFGNPQITLKNGIHDMYFVVSSGNGAIHTSAIHIIDWRNSIGDTFWTHMNININSNSETSITVPLKRVTTMLKLKSTDIVPENGKYIEVTPGEWYYGINYITGVPTCKMSKTPIICNLENTGDFVEISIYGISSDNETTTQIDVFAMSKTNNSIKYTKLNNVPFKANRITTMTGNMFGVANDNKCNYILNIDTQWTTGYNATW